MAYEFGNPTDIGGHTRQADVHRLHQRLAHPLVPGGESKDIHRTQQGRNILTPSGERDVLGNTQTTGLILKRPALLTITNQQQPGIRNVGASRGKSGQQVALPFDRREPPHGANDDAVRINSEAIAHGKTIVPGRAGKR